MAFNRGASKQYGVWWWSNVSVYNRQVATPAEHRPTLTSLYSWGFKGYPADATSGTSLSLMRRLMYSQIMYNCIYVSFESAWLNGTDLSPVGKKARSVRQRESVTRASVSLAQLGQSMSKPLTCLLACCRRDSVCGSKLGSRPKLQSGAPSDPHCRDAGLLRRLASTPLSVHGRSCQLPNLG